ncbi:MAG: hypothetical protein QOE36_222 [Gaiellaceae bacterium]|nr:hypothetical protein [Gaiellaceae bacterium]
MSNRRKLAALATLVVAAVAATVVLAFAGGGGGRAAQADALPASSAKSSGDPDAHANAANTPGDAGLGGPNAAAEFQAVANAYPAQQIGAAQTHAAQKAYNDVKIRGNKGSKKQPGIWNAIGPSRAFMPGFLTQWFATWILGQDYVTSGRVTTLAISPTCTQGQCTLWLGAAGGGIWKAEHALHTNNLSWKRSSTGLGSNAIGTIVIDPNNPNVLYAGTGEPNASQDSEAGVGLYKSTNGGDTWTLLANTSAIADLRAISSVAVDPTNSNVVYMGTARAIRGVSSVTGGGQATTQPELGVYKSTDGGQTWSLVFDEQAVEATQAPPGTNPRGVTQIAIDPLNHNRVYVSGFTIGIYRSHTGTAGSFQQVFKGPSSGLATTDRTAFALANNAGKIRIYALDGSVGPTGNPPAPAARLFRTDDASLLVDGSPNTAQWKNITANGNDPANRVSPYFAPWDICTAQCWYDMGVVSPAGQPDTVYVFGSYSYPEAGRFDNARALIKSTTAGEPDPANANRAWADLTYDSHQPAFGMHPDQHALVVDPSNPNVYFEGSDGGVIRNDGTFTDITSQCDQRRADGLIGASGYIACKNLLWAAPTTLYSLNDGLDTLQFQSLSVNPQNPTGELMGGTQDNGTWLYTGSSTTWNQTIYGDGGQSGFDVGNPQVRFNQFFGGAGDINFSGGDPAKWFVLTGAPAASNESVAFYWPQIYDPKVPHTIFAGFQHVWRTQDNGGDQAHLEADCSEFTTPYNDPTCGDMVPLGGPAGNDTPGDLVGAFYGADKAGALANGTAVTAVERASSDTSTLWAATSKGRLFISQNGNAPASTVTYTRVDTATTPNRFISSVAIDNANPNVAYVSFMGYNTTPGSTAPGHVFKVTYNSVTHTATWQDLSYNIGDLPVDDIVRDDVTGDLYAATDFTALRLENGGSSWNQAGANLPPVEVAGLTIVPSARKLYAATHGLGAWSMTLP